MKSLLKFFRERSLRKKEDNGATALFRERLHHSLLRKNRAERKIFIKELQMQIWEPKHLLDLSNLAKQNQSDFLKSQCAFAKKHKIKTLKQVGRQCVFFQLLCIARELHGSDIDHLISFRSAAEVVVNELLLHD